MRCVVATVVLLGAAACSESSNDRTASPTDPTSAALEESPPNRPLSLPGPVPAGAHTLWSLEQPFDIELDEGWSAGWEPGDDVAVPLNVVALEHPLSSGFVRLTLWANNEEVTIDGDHREDLRGFVRGLAGAEPIQEQEVSLAGQTATRFDFTWSGETRAVIPFQSAGEELGTASYVLTTGAPQHWIVLDTPGVPLLVNWTVEPGPGTAALEAEADALVTPILASLEPADVPASGLSGGAVLPPDRQIEPEAVVEAPPGFEVAAVTDDRIVALGYQVGAVTSIDPVTNAVALVEQYPATSLGFAAGHDSVWVSDFETSELRRLDQETLEEVTTMETGRDPSRVLVTNDAVWTADHRGGTVTRFDPTTNQRVATVQLSGPGRGGPEWMGADGDDLWVEIPFFDAVARIDMTTDQVVAWIEVPNPCGRPVVIDERLFVGSCDTDLVHVVNTSTNELEESIPIGGYVQDGGAFLVDGNLWFPTDDGQDVARLVRVDPDTLDILDSIRLDTLAASGVEAFGSLWLMGPPGVTRLPLAALAG